MPTLLARSQLDSPTVVLLLVLDTLVLDILDMLVLDILVMPTGLLLLQLPMDTLVLLLPLLSADTPLLDTDMPDITASVRLRPKLILMLMLTLSLRWLLDSPSITPLLPDMPVLDTSDMLVILDSDTPVLLDTDTQVLLDLDTDMLDITASVRLKLMLMLIPSVRSMLDSPSITPTLPDMATMLELSPDTDLMLLPPTLGMLVLDMLVMLDSLAMLVWNTIKKTKLKTTPGKLQR